MFTVFKDEDESFYPNVRSVLDAFAVESDPGRSTLERYLRLYPEYAGDLIDLSRELSREACDDPAPLSIADRALIDTAWAQHINWNFTNG